MDLTALARHFVREHRSQRRHRLATATATTADGVVALIQVQYVADLDVDDDALDEALLDLVEEATRRAIVRWHVTELPSMGDVAGWVPSSLEDARVEHATVALSDVQVTSELRRLVAGREAGAP